MLEVMWDVSFFFFVFFFPSDTDREKRGASVGWIIANDFDPYADTNFQ